MSCTTAFVVLRSATNDAMPPSNLKSSLRVGALVDDGDLQPAVEVRELAQLLRQRVEARTRVMFLKIFGIGLERDLGAAAPPDR